jgi:hypothetical protein
MSLKNNKIKMQLRELKSLKKDHHLIHKLQSKISKILKANKLKVENHKIMNLRKKMLILLKLLQIKIQILKVNTKRKEWISNQEKKISITHQAK